MVEGIREFTLLLALVVVAPAATSAARGEEMRPALPVGDAVEAAVGPAANRSMGATEIAKQFGADAIPEWEKYLDHEEWRTRSTARFGLAEIGIKSEDPGLRRELMTQIVRSALNDTPIDGKLARLFGFRPRDATEEVRDLLLERLTAPEESGSGLRYEPAVIEAVGRLGIQEAIPRLMELRMVEPVDGNQQNPFHGRYAMLALAQMGDSRAVRDTIATLEAIEDGMERTFNLRYLARIRKPEAVEHLKNYLFSDVEYERPDGALPPIREQDYATWALRSMLVVPEDVTYTNFREWMAEQKTYTFK